MKTRTHWRPVWLPVLLLAPLAVVGCQEQSTAPMTLDPSMDAVQAGEIPAPADLAFDQGTMTLSWTWSDAEEGWDQVGSRVFVNGAAVPDKWTEKSYTLGEELEYTWTATPALEAGSYEFCVQVMAKNKTGKKPVTYHEQACIEVEIGEGPPPELGWTVVDHGLGTSNALQDIWGSSGTDIFVVGSNGALWHYDGTSWSAVASPIGMNSIWKVWGSSGSNVYALGNFDVLHYNGSVWSSTALSSTVPGGGCLAPGAVNNLWGSSATDVYVVGTCSYQPGGAIWHYDGSSWSGAESGTTASFSENQAFPSAIWGSGPDDVFAVGNQGRVWHRGSGAWDVMLGPNPLTYVRNFHDVWGSGPGDVFAVGNGVSADLTAVAVIAHYGGAAWAIMSISTSALTLNGVWGNSGDDVFAVGPGGAILHYDGSAWTPMTSGTEVELTAVWGSSGSDVYAVGANGTILHYGSGTP